MFSYQEINNTPSRRERRNKERYLRRKMKRRLNAQIWYWEDQLKKIGYIQRGREIEAGVGHFSKECRKSGCKKLVEFYHPFLFTNYCYCHTVLEFQKKKGLLLKNGWEEVTFTKTTIKQKTYINRKWIEKFIRTIEPCFGKSCKDPLIDDPKIGFVQKENPTEKFCFNCAHRKQSLLS